MERICVVGMSWRHGNAKALEAYTLPPEDRRQRVAELPHQLGAREVVYLATCNRVEVILAGDRDTPLADYRGRVHEALTGRPSPGEATRRLRVWAGEGAVEHLFLVAAGLDSAQVGEHEIPGQLRQAMELAREAGSLGRELEWLLGEALRVGRSVRAESRVGAGRLSLSEIALDRVRRHLVDRRGTVALVGVSPMTERCGERLASDGHPLIVVNRRPERAADLARSLSAGLRSLEDFCARPDPVDVVVSATGAPQPIFGRATLERLAGRAPHGHGPLLVDLAVPPDVDAPAAAAVGLEHVGMDEITAEASRNSERRREDAAAARQLVDEAIADLLRQLTHRALSPVVAGLSRRYRETALVGVERLFRQRLSGLAEGDRQAVREWAETLARRLAHIPMVGLRALAAEAGMPAVRTFLAASDDSLAAELSTLATEIPDRDPDRPREGRR